MHYADDKSGSMLLLELRASTTRIRGQLAEIEQKIDEFERKVEKLATVNEGRPYVIPKDQREKPAWIKGRRPWVVIGWLRRSN